jgi:hypothetical protein
MRRLALLSLLLLGAGGCSTVYYAAMSQLGWAKADLLANRVQQARDALNQARIQLADALPDFADARTASGDERTARSRALAASLADAQANATLIGQRRAAVEKAAGALFADWQREIRDAADAGLRERRQQRYDAFHPAYERLLEAMRGAEASLAPVLAAMRAEVTALRAPTAQNAAVPGIAAADGDRAIRDLQLAAALSTQYMLALETID